MSWLKGTTTYGNLAEKITQLICAEIADDAGVTCAAGDAWRRTVSGQQQVAPPSAQDVSITQQHRAGYWNRTDDCAIYNDATGKAATWIQQATCWTAFPSTSLEALGMNARIYQANTTAGDYSTARVYIGFMSVSDTTYAAVQGTVSVTPNASGVCSITVAGGTMTFKIGDPSGIVAVGACFQRTYTARYLGGIDHWRGFDHSPDGAVTQNTALPGTSGTDYEYTSGPSAWASPSWYNSYGNSGYYQTGSIAASSTVRPTRLYTSGVGYRTNNSLTGAIYKVTFARSDGMGQLSTGSATGYLLFRHGSTGLAADGTTRRFGIGGYRNAATPAAQGYIFCRPFSATPTSAANVQYWISVTPTHLTLILNGDTTNGSGVLTFNMLAKVTVDEPTLDSGCWAIGRGPGDFTSTSSGAMWYRLGSPFLVEAASRIGFRDDGRDWQTGMGRLDCDPVYDTGAAPWLFSSGGCDLSTPDANAIWNGPEDLGSSGYYTGNTPMSTDRITKPVLADPRWQMAGFALLDSTLYGYAETSRTAGWKRHRGYVNENTFMLPVGSFASGDQLQDQSTGDLYFLLIGSAYVAWAGIPQGVMNGLAVKQA